MEALINRCWKTFYSYQTSCIICSQFRVHRRKNEFLTVVDDEKNEPRKEAMKHFHKQNKEVMLVGIENRDGLYKAVLKVRDKNVSMTASRRSECKLPVADLWHHRLGYLSVDLVNRPVSFVNGMKNFLLNYKQSVPCLYTRQANTST